MDFHSAINVDSKLHLGQDITLMHHLKTVYIGSTELVGKIPHMKLASFVMSTGLSSQKKSGDVFIRL